MRAAGREDADLDARILLCDACGIDHADLIRDPDALLGAAAPVLDGYLKRRLADEPVSRILGRREFWGLNVLVTPDVLDPRPETEGVVGAVLEAIGGRRDTALRILDLGTGSGAILCALLHELPHAFGVGVDRSLAACRVAGANAQTLGLHSRAAIICADYVESIGARFDIVVSNPPYIKTDVIDALERAIRYYDPPLALDGGVDGLSAYRAILPHLATLLNAGGVAAFECGYDEGALVAAMMRNGGLGKITIIRDLAGHERVVTAVKTKRDRWVLRPSFRS